MPQCIRGSLGERLVPVVEKRRLGNRHLATRIDRRPQPCNSVRLQLDVALVPQLGGLTADNDDRRLAVELDVFRHRPDRLSDPQPAKQNQHDNQTQDRNIERGSDVCLDLINVENLGISFIKQYFFDTKRIFFANVVILGIDPLAESGENGQIIVERARLDPASASKTQDLKTQ